MLRNRVLTVEDRESVAAVRYRTMGQRGAEGSGCWGGGGSSEQLRGWVLAVTCAAGQISAAGRADSGMAAGAAAGNEVVEAHSSQPRAVLCNSPVPTVGGQAAPGLYCCKLDTAAAHHRSAALHRTAYILPRGDEAAAKGAVPGPVYTGAR